VQQQIKFELPILVNKALNGHFCSS